MGILDTLFGNKETHYPPLDSHSEAADQFRDIEPELRAFVETIDENVEVVPAPDESYIFFGKPPKVFGLAWIRDGKLKNLSEVVEEKKVPPYRAEALADLLRAAYKQSKGDERYSTQLGDRTVVVTPSDGLRRSVHEIVEKIGA